MAPACPSVPAGATAEAGHDVPSLMREAWPRHTAKRGAIAADVPHETARNWLRRRARPLADALLRMADNDEAMAAALRRRLDAARADRDARSTDARGPMDRRPPAAVTP